MILPKNLLLLLLVILASTMAEEDLEVDSTVRFGFAVGGPGYYGFGGGYRYFATAIELNPEKPFSRNVFPSSSDGKIDGIDCRSVLSRTDRIIRQSSDSFTEVVQPAINNAQQ
ncbi:unnamed protein product [Nezara viridula]|uniref:Neuropeptide n=1 Tax=Nezara viridula TaxID=85310 RepID=A0A9P0HG97_NEZVI|nr:unnamed protein product [Nezara viridula]